jgi:hypothetical protein
MRVFVDPVSLFLSLFPLMHIGRISPEDPSQLTRAIHGFLDPASYDSAPQVEHQQKASGNLRFTRILATAHDRHTNNDKYKLE